jgi:hypothetical protein
MSFDPGPLAAALRMIDGDPIAVIRGRAAHGYGFEELQDGYPRELGVPIR